MGIGYHLPLRGGFACLVAVMDWFNQYVFSREVSITMDKEFCIAGLESALRRLGRSSRIALSPEGADGS